MTYWQAFGEAVSSRRKRLGMSFDRCAEKVGVTTAYIRMIEKGERTPSGQTILNLAEALKTTPSQLMKEVEERDYP